MTREERLAVLLQETLQLSWRMLRSMRADMMSMMLHQHLAAYTAAARDAGVDTTNGGRSL
jgi:hypothetical protein